MLKSLEQLIDDYGNAHQEWANAIECETRVDDPRTRKAREKTEAIDQNIRNRLSAIHDALDDGTRREQRMAMKLIRGSSRRQQKERK